MLAYTYIEHGKFGLLEKPIQYWKMHVMLLCG